MPGSTREVPNKWFRKSGRENFRETRVHSAQKLAAKSW